VNDQTTGALVAAAVIFLSFLVAVVVALIGNHSDRQRHEQDREAARLRHEELTAAVKKRDEAMTALLRANGRHDSVLLDHAEVLEDHASRLDRLLPSERAARPRPKP
jgi:hypothetical protein